jgi:hypothetical protein
MNDYKEKLPEYFIDGPPWEHRDSIGIFLAIVETIKGIFLFPETVISVMKRKGGLIDAFSFSILMQVLATLTLASVSKLFGFNFELIPHELLEGGILGDISSGILVLFFPVGVFLQILIFSLSIYIAIRIIGNDNYQASTIIRLYAYTSGATSIWTIVPGIGSLFAFFFSFRFLFIGLKVLYGEGSAWLVKTVIISIIVTPFLIIAVALPLGSLILIFGG